MSQDSEATSDHENDVNEKLAREIRGALKNPELPNLYFNGFSQTLSTSDILIVLKRNDIPVAVLNASYTTAKTLSRMLGALVAELEARTEHEIMTINDISAEIQ